AAASTAAWMRVMRRPSPTQVVWPLASAPAGSTPSPTATGEMISTCPSRRTTASTGATASMPAGNGCPMSIRVAAGSGAGAEELGGLVRWGRTAQPSRNASGARGARTALTSPAGTLPTAAATAMLRGATGLTSASMRASTSTSGVSLAIRCGASLFEFICNLLSRLHSHVTWEPGYVPAERGHMTEQTINLRGLKCPLPPMRARKALSGLKSGDLLIVECTDPLAAIDIPNLLNQTGDKLEASERADDVLVFRIRKK